MNPPILLMSYLVALLTFTLRSSGLIVGNVTFVIHRIFFFCRVTLKKTFAQDSRHFISPHPPLFALVRFRAPPSPKGTVVLARTYPLPLNFYTCEI